jgi:hypothetical protein
MALVKFRYCLTNSIKSCSRTTMFLTFGGRDNRCRLFNAFHKPITPTRQPREKKRKRNDRRSKRQLKTRLWLRLAIGWNSLAIVWNNVTFFKVSTTIAILLRIKKRLQPLFLRDIFWHKIWSSWTLVLIFEVLLIDTRPLRQPHTIVPTLRKESMFLTPRPT